MASGMARDVVQCDHTFFSLGSPSTHHQVIEHKMIKCVGGYRLTAVPHLASHMSSVLLTEYQMHKLIGDFYK